MMRGKFAVVCALLVFAGASSCRRPQPAPAVPVPAANADSIAADHARQVEAARRDSMARAVAARADAARRDSIAAAEAARRAAAASAEARAVVLRPVYFDFEADSLRSDAISELDAKVAVLREQRDVRVRVEGHADDRGSDEYNLALGQRRSAAVKRYFAARGIDEARVDVTSFGEQRPACRGDTEMCWQENRRDEFVIVSGAIRAPARPD